MNKRFIVWKNPKKLYNKYFFKGEKYIENNMNIYILIGFLKLLKSLLLRKRYYFFNSNLTKSFSLKSLLINFYANIFYQFNYDINNKCVYIIGDIFNPMNRGLLLSTINNKYIEVWIIFQGTGGIKDKINIFYPGNVNKVYFPFDQDSSYEKNLIKEANSRNKKIKFLNINSSLNISIDNLKNSLAIFQGYDKSKRLYPFYIIFIIKVLLKIDSINKISKFKNVVVYLHPRLKFFTLLNYLKLRSNVTFKIFDNNHDNDSFSVIISYSPTINSSIPKLIWDNQNFYSEIGKKFSLIDLNQKINNYNLNN